MYIPGHATSNKFQRSTLPSVVEDLASPGILHPRVIFSRVNYAPLENLTSPGICILKIIASRITNYEHECVFCVEHQQLTRIVFELSLSMLWWQQPDTDCQQARRSRTTNCRVTSLETFLPSVHLSCRLSAVHGLGISVVVVSEAILYPFLVFFCVFHLSVMSVTDAGFEHVLLYLTHAHLVGFRRALC